MCFDSEAQEVINNLNFDLNLEFSIEQLYQEFKMAC